MCVCTHHIQDAGDPTGKLYDHLALVGHDIPRLMHRGEKQHRLHLLLSTPMLDSQAATGRPPRHIIRANIQASCSAK